MSILDIFEKVNLVLPMEQRRFFNCFDDTVRELEATYGSFVFEKGTEYQPPAALCDENAVLPLYHSAIVDNIVFMASGEEARKGEFLRKSREAYLKYWKDDAKGRKMRRLEW